MIAAASSESTRNAAGDRCSATAMEALLRSVQAYFSAHFEPND
jgi:hypothetical protein